MWKEFKEFAMKGNVIDLTVGIVIGGAFAAIVTAFVEFMIMPIVGALTAGVDFKELAVQVNGVSIGYGQVLNALINFIIIAFFIFLVVRAINRMKKKEEAAATTKACPFCKMDIPIEAVKCGHCTADLTFDVAESK